MGDPFRSRRQGKEGLKFPKGATWPTFICELCTVRQVIQREPKGPTDFQLLMLERIRILDIVSYWAKSTHNTYKTKFKVIQQFEELFGLKILEPTYLEEPPTSIDIPLMWCQELYSLRQSNAF